MRLPITTLFVAVLVGCGPAEKPPLAPPEVKLLVPGTSVIDTTLTGTIQVTGCEGPRKIVLRDGARELLEVTANSIDAHFQLGPEVLKGRGFTVDLVLQAEATCTDGRTNKSRQAGVSFFPVAQLIALPGDEQVVTDTFIIEGEGQGATFLGCALNSNGTTTSIARVSVNGEILKQLDTPFRCSGQLKFTARHPDNGTRWAYEPGVGAIAFNPALQALVSTNHGATHMEMILPSGDALSYSPGIDPNFARLALTGGVVWTTNTAFTPIAPIRVLGGSQARVVVREEDSMVAYDNVSVEEYDVANKNLLDVKRVFAFPRINATPRVMLSADANRLFVAEPTGQDVTNTYACATNINGCVGPGLVWQAVAVPGEAIDLTTYANDTRVLVVTTRGTWSFDAQSGAALNLRSEPTVPTGALFPHSTVTNTSPAYFLLNGAPPSAFDPFPNSVELIGVDDALQGETFRLQIASGSIAAGLDEAGVLWMRIGTKLARALPMPEYRLAR